MLRHLMNEFHLHHASDFFSFVAEDQFGDLLIAHICRTVDLRAEIFDLTDTLWLGLADSPFLDQRKISANILKDTEARFAWSSMSCDF